MKLYILIILNTIIVSLAFAQEKKFIRQGNSAYADSVFDESELKYRKALEKNSNSYDAGFNLGDALYRQKKYDEAIKQFENLSHSETSKENIAKAYHNLGNSLLQAKDDKGQPRLEDAVEAYKNALRNNPKDNETRFNLAQAQKMLQQQKQNQDQNKDDNKDKKDNKDKQDQKDKDKKDQDKKDKDKKDEQKDKQDQQDKDKQKDQQKQEEQKKQQQIPKEKAEQMLKALENDEKDLQKKMKMQKVKGKKVKVEKDW
jgi:hypothetical protein